MKATAAARPAPLRVYPSVIHSQLSEAAILRKIFQRAGQQGSVPPTEAEWLKAQERSRRRAAEPLAFRAGAAAVSGRDAARAPPCEGARRAMLVGGGSYDTLSTLAVPRPAGARTWGMAA